MTWSTGTPSLMCYTKRWFWIHKFHTRCACNAWDNEALEAPREVYCSTAASHLARMIIELVYPEPLFCILLRSVLTDFIEKSLSQDKLKPERDHYINFGHDFYKITRQEANQRLLVREGQISRLDT